MSLGSWDPDAAAAAANPHIEEDQLREFISWSRQDQLHDLEALLGEQVQALSGIMQLEASDWASAAGKLDDDELLHLVRFFAVAENLPGWLAQAKSPVIPLAKELRKRGQRLDRDFLLWLRSVNDNRFLPYGPL